MDPEIGNLADADLLIDGGCIAAIGRGLDAGDAEIVDGTGHIAAPGLVDAHHHVWQAALRNRTGDWSLLDYVCGIRMVAAGLFRPDDLYAASLHGLLAAIDAGVTTTADYCHNLLSVEHAEESLRGVRESGARVVWGYGFNHPPQPTPGLEDVPRRISLLRDLAKREFASRDGLVTLGVCPEEAGFWPDAGHGSAQFRAARELGARIFWHANSARDLVGRPARDAARLEGLGLLGPDVTLVHMNLSEPDEWAAVAASGASVCFTPETELQMSMGWPSIAEAASRKIAFGLGIDILSNHGVDLRAQCRLLLQAERHRLRGADVGHYRPGVPLSCAEALHWGTLGGARALGLDHRIGSLTPGKAADIVLYDARGMGLAGFDRENPAAALLLHAGAESVSTVLVGGEVRKRDGELAGAARASALLQASSERIAGEIGRLGGSAGILEKGREALAAALSGRS